jgi:hypothetical protein
MRVLRAAGMAAMMVLAGMAAIFAVAFSGEARAAGPVPRLDELTEIPLHSGVNHIKDLAGSGLDGVITRAWRENGYTHGFTVFTVMVRDPTRSVDDAWDFVSFFDGDNETLAPTDDPHAGDDTVRSVRFARARVNGKRETLALIAERNTGENDSVSEPSTVSFKLYKLSGRGDDAQAPDRFFQRIAAWKSKRTYGNADTALSVELHLPLPVEHPAVPPADACP